MDFIGKQECAEIEKRHSSGFAAGTRGFSIERCFIMEQTTTTRSWYFLSGCWFCATPDDRLSE